MEIRKKIQYENNITVSETAKLIEDIAPLSLQESWDNSGMIIGFCSSDVKKIMACLEITGAIVDEAITARVDMIITHHPMIFGSINSVRDSDPQGRWIMELIRHGISVYSCHTPFDKAKGGNNDRIAELLGLSSVKNLKTDEEEYDIARMGRLKKPQTFMQLIETAAGELQMSVRNLRAVGDLDTVITNVGICTGAGADMIEAAAAAGCQLFVTGDVKYHEAQTAHALGICVLDAGHYGTEKFFASNMREKLEKKLPDDVEVIESHVNIDPFRVL